MELRACHSTLWAWELSVLRGSHISCRCIRAQSRCSVMGSTVIIPMDTDLRGWRGCKPSHSLETRGVDGAWAAHLVHLSGQSRPRPISSGSRGTRCNPHRASSLWCTSGTSRRGASTCASRFWSVGCRPVLHPLSHRKNQPEKEKRWIRRSGSPWAFVSSSVHLAEMSADVFPWHGSVLLPGWQRWPSPPTLPLGDGSE